MTLTSTSERRRGRGGSRRGARRRRPLRRSWTDGRRRRVRSSAEDRRTPEPSSRSSASRSADAIRAAAASPPRTIDVRRAPAPARAPRRAPRTVAGGAVTRRTRPAALPDGTPPERTLEWRRFYLTTAIDYANGDPHSVTRSRRSAPTRSRGIAACAATTCISSSGMDEHGQKVAQAAAERGVSPQAVRRRHRRRASRRCGSRLGISYDQFIRTTDADHKRGVRALIERIHERTPDDFYEKSYEGWYCVGCELFKRDDEIVDGKCVLHPDARAAVDEGAQLVLPPHALPAVPRAPVRRAPGIPRSPRRGATRSSRCSSRDSRTSRSRARACRGRFPSRSSCRPAKSRARGSGSTRCRTTSRRPAFPRSGYHDRWPAQLHVIGKDITRLHCVDLAGDAASRRAAAARARLGARLHAASAANGSANRPALRLDSTRRSTASAPTRSATSCCAKSPFDGDGELLVRALRRALHRRPRERTRQPREPRDRDGREVLRRRRAERIGHGTLDHADAADLAEYHARDGRQPRLPAARRPQARDGVRVARQRVRPVAVSRGRSRRIRTSRGELERVLAAIIRQLARHAIHLAPFMPNKAQELWTQIGGPGRVEDQRFDGADRST